MIKKPRKIDNSLTERYGIVTLLESITRENITVDEMEIIGDSLRKSGKRALSPLVRKIWREKNGDLIARYTYLLDFFEEHSWLDQLIKIALTRKDLEEEGKSALLNALEGYGVDVDSPPFDRLLAETGGTLRESLARLLEKGEKGLVVFMEGFLTHQIEVQLAIIRELARFEDARVLRLFEIFVDFDEPAIVAEGIITLGKVRLGGAVLILRQLLARQDFPQRELALRSLRRLSFLGVSASTEVTSTPVALPYRAAYLSPVDGSGAIFLLLARWADSSSLDMLMAELHETIGLRDAWGHNNVSVEEFGQIFEELNEGGALIEVASSHAISLVRDAIARNHKNQTYLPPDFYVRRRIFGTDDLSPARFMPKFDGYDLEALASASHLVAESDELLDDPFFQNWFLSCRRIYEIAEELEKLENEASSSKREKIAEELLTGVIRDLAPPLIERIMRRLFLTADLMIRAGREKRTVRLTLATALSLSRSRLPHHLHPFIRRYFLESVDMARAAIDEGYDYRRDAGSEDDEYWD